jgi:hypothetical protein
MATKVGKNSEKYSTEICCKFCDYICYKKQHYNQHLLTNKHKNNEINTVENKIVKNIFDCDCGKKYKDRTGLWKHKRTCNSVKKSDLATANNNDITFLTNLVLEVVKNNSELQKQNQELQIQMLEVIKNGTNNTTTTTNSNNNITNKTFNLQFFLNEECKDALNISEFVSSIKMDLDDLEKTGLLGYVEGISNIINKNLNDLDETRRPIHCSDVKREVLYIKNDDQWIKENGTNKPVLTKAIKQVAHENIRQISEWRKKHPDCTDPDSKKNDLYLNIVSNAMSGSTSEEQVKNYEKIISNVAKEVTIDKANIL